MRGGKELTLLYFCLWGSFTLTCVTGNIYTDINYLQYPVHSVCVCVCVSMGGSGLKNQNEAIRNGTRWFMKCKVCAQSSILKMQMHLQRLWRRNASRELRYPRWQSGAVIAAFR